MADGWSKRIGGKAKKKIEIAAWFSSAHLYRPRVLASTGRFIAGEEAVPSNHPFLTQIWRGVRMGLLGCPSKGRIGATQFNMGATGVRDVSRGNKLPRKIAIPIGLLGVLTALSTGAQLAFLVYTRDETLFDLHSMLMVLFVLTCGLFLTGFVLWRNLRRPRMLRLRFGLRTLLILSAVAPILCYVGWRQYARWQLGKAREVYEECRATITPGVLSEVAMSDEMARQLSDVRESWRQTYCELNGPYSQALDGLQRAPTVSHLVDFITYRMPPFPMESPQESLHPVAVAAFQVYLLPCTMDACIHVSEDGSVAMIRSAPTLISLFEDTPNGMRETIWQK